MNTTEWTFEHYIETIIHLSEISEVPGIEDQRTQLLKEVWQFYPNECKALGLTNGVKA